MKMNRGVFILVVIALAVLVFDVFSGCRGCEYETCRDQCRQTEEYKAALTECVKKGKLRIIYCYDNAAYLACNCGGYANGGE